MWLNQQDMGIDDIFTEDVIYTESWSPPVSYTHLDVYKRQQQMILSILVYTFFSRMFDLMLPPVAKHSIVVA